MKTIVVNGASSSGRTSLVREFAAQANNGYQTIHIDEFTNDLAPGMWDRCCGSDEGWVEIGMAFNDHLKVLAQGSRGVIADAFYKLHSPVEHLFTVLGRENVFFVHLYCDLHELERREKARGNRRIGLAKSQFEQMSFFNDYDLQIDSTAASPKRCAKILIKEISNQRL